MDSIKFNKSWFSDITVTDELHVAAIDHLLLRRDDGITGSISGIVKLNGRYMPKDGTHSLVLKDKSTITVNCSTTDTKRMYELKISGDSAIALLHRTLNAIRVEIINESFINTFDNFTLMEMKLLEKGNYIGDVVCIPMDGIYIVSTDKKDGYMVIKKCTNGDTKRYLIDIVGSYYHDKVKEIINGDANTVRVAIVTVFNDGLNARVMNKAPIVGIYPSQQKISEYVIDTYKSKPTKNVSILVSGNSGLGKSTVATVIAQQLKVDLGVDPYLIKDLNLFTNQIQYHPIIAYYSPKKDTPVILLLNEIDIAMMHALNIDNNQQNGGNQNVLAIAANKTNMNNFLDAINDESFLITVMTTNVSIDDMNANYGVFCRKGRFDKHIHMVNKDDITLLDPVI